MTSLRAILPTQTAAAIENVTAERDDQPHGARRQAVRRVEIEAPGPWFAGRNGIGHGSTLTGDESHFQTAGVGGMMARRTRVSGIRER